MSRSNAGRINVKFLVILIAVLLVGIGGIVAGAAWVQNKNPQTFIDRGDGLVEEGRYDEAIGSYRRAISRLPRGAEGRQAQAELAIKIADVLLAKKVDSASEAANTFRDVARIWVDVARIMPKESEAGQRVAHNLLEYYHSLAETFGTIEAWNVLWRQSDEMMKWSGQQTLARKYRAIAQVNRMRSIDLQPDDILQAQRDLVTALSANPADVELNFHYALWHLTEASRYARIQDAEKMKESVQTGLRTMRTVAEDMPDDLKAQQYYLQVLYEAGTRLGSEEIREEAIELAGKIESQISAETDPSVTLAVAKLIGRIDTEPLEEEVNGRIVPTRRGFLRERELLEKHIKNHPADHSALLTLAESYKRSGRWDDAIDVYQEISKDTPLPVTVEALKVQEYQNQAQYELGNIHLTLMALHANDPKLREKHLADAQAAVEKLAERTDEESALVQLLRGKIHYSLATEEDLWLAVKYFTSADKQFAGRNIDALMLSADALMRLDQSGAAMDRLNKVLRSPFFRVPFKLHAATQLGEMHFNLNQYAKADDLVNKVLAVTPANQQAAILKSRIMIEAAKTAEPEQQVAMRDVAVRVLQPSIDQGSTAALRQQARAYVAAGDRDQARSILEARFAQQSGDLGLLEELVTIDMAEGKKDQAIARINAVQKQVKDDPRLDLILARVEGRRDDATEIQYDRIVSSVDTDTERRLARYAFHMARNEPDQAEAILDELAAQDPTHPEVIRTRFERGIESRNWQLCESVIADAKKAKFSDTDILVMEGRLQMGQAKYEEARVTLTKARDLRPLHSDTWLLRGNARRMTGDLQGAIEDYEKAIGLKPTNLIARERMFEVYHMREQHAQALDTIKEAADVARNDRGLQKRYLDYEGRFGSKADAIAGRMTIKQRDPEDWDNRRMLADLYMLVGNMEAAEAELADLVAESADSRENIAAMAVFRLKQGNPQAGIDLMREHIERQRKAGNLEDRDYTAFARFLRGAGYQDLAAAAYREAQKLEDPATLPVSREVAEWYLQRQNEEGMLEEALTILRKVVDLTGNVSVTRQLIQTLIDLNQYEEAQTRLNALVAAHGEDVEAAVLQGVIYAGTRRPAEAMNAFDRAVALAPSNPLPYLRRAQHRFNDRQDTIQSEVKADLLRAVELDKTMIAPHELLVRWYRRTNNPVAAAEQLQSLIEERPDYPKARVDLAEIYLEQGKLNEMARLLDESAKELPGVPAWHQMRARLFRTRNEPAAALRELEMAYEIRQNPRTLGDLVQGLVDAGQSPQAIELMNEQSEMVNSESALLALQAWAYAKMDQRENALTYFTRAFDTAQGLPAQMSYIVSVMQREFSLDEVETFFRPRANNDPTGLIRYVLHQIEHRNDKADEAIAGLERLVTELDKGPGQDDAILMMAMRLLATITYEEKQYAKAAKVWSRLLEFQPEDMAALNNMAFIYAEHLDRAEDALPLAKRASELVLPDSQAQANVLDTLGWSYYKSGNLSDAETTLRQSISRYPMWANRLHLATVLKDRRKIGEARDEAYAARDLAQMVKDEDAIARINQFLSSLGG